MKNLLFIVCLLLVVVLSLSITTNAKINLSIDQHNSMLMSNIPRDGRSDGRSDNGRSSSLTLGTTSNSNNNNNNNNNNRDRFDLSNSAPAFSTTPSFSILPDPKVQATKLTSVRPMNKKQLNFKVHNETLNMINKKKKEVQRNPKLREPDAVAKYYKRLETIRAEMIRAEKESGILPQVNPIMLTREEPTMQIAEALNFSPASRQFAGSEQKPLPTSKPSRTSGTILMQEELLLNLATKDVNIPCPTMDNQPVSARFAMIKMCAALANDAYHLSKDGTGPQVGKEYTLVNGKKVMIESIELTGLNSLNFGLGKMNGPWMIASDTQNIYVAFRGSYSLQDWLDDFEATFTELTVSGDEYGYIHTGFAQVWQSQNVLNKLKSARNKYPNKKVIFVGHSLGGAVATLHALEAALELGIVPDLYTFGSPRVGDAQFAATTIQRVNHIRVKNRDDLVTTVPAFYTPISPPFPTSRATLPRLFYHAADIAVNVWGAGESPVYACIEDVTPWNPRIPKITDHSMTSGYIPNCNALA